MGAEGFNISFNVGAEVPKKVPDSSKKREAPDKLMAVDAKVNKPAESSPAGQLSVVMSEMVTYDKKSRELIPVLTELENYPKALEALYNELVGIALDFADLGFIERKEILDAVSSGLKELITKVPEEGYKTNAEKEEAEKTLKETAKNIAKLIQKGSR